MDSVAIQGQGVTTEQKSAIEVSTMRKVMMRLAPFLMLCYAINFIDRTNIANGALQMNGDLHLDPAVYGLGYGLFFLGYFIFEVPSNLVLYRVGARRWIARIMFTWGLCATGMAFIQGEHSFYIVRFLLGLSEAGFQPGIFFFLTLWFPAVYRGRVLGLFFAAIPLSSVLGNLFAAGIFYTMDDVFGLRGWQWLYIIEGLPAVLLAPVVLFYLQDRVSDAKWLAANEREWLNGQLQQELQAREKKQSFTLQQALTNPWVLFLGVIYFTNVCLNNVNSFIPQIVKSFGLTNSQTSLVNAIPAACALVCVVLWGRRSDKNKERYGHAALATIIGGTGLIASVLITDPTLRVVAFAVTISGTLSFAPVFWSIAPSFLSGAAAAGGLAAISAIGILGGWVAPWFTGYMKVQTGGFGWGLGSIGVLGILGGIALYVVGRRQGAAIETLATTKALPITGVST